MSSIYTCDNCHDTMKAHSFYKHAKKCYDLALEKCELCKKKLYTETDIAVHQDHQRTSIMTLKEQKLRLNHISNPNKKRKYEEIKDSVKADQQSEAHITLNATTHVEIQQQTQQAELNKPNSLNKTDLVDKTANPVNPTDSVREFSLNEIQTLQLELQKIKTQYEACKIENEKQAEELKRLIQSSEQYRFESLEEITKSGQAVLWKAKCTETATGKSFWVAIKTYKHEDDRNTEVSTQFILGGIKTVTAIRKMLSIKASFLSSFAIVFKWYHGSLEEVNVSRRKFVEEVGIKEVFLQAAKALQQVHGANVLHLDIKPRNFFYEAIPNAKPNIAIVIGDFGLAKELPSTHSAGDSVPVVYCGNRGTSYFRAPEIRSMGKAYVASDIYSLGVTFALWLAHQPLTTSAQKKDNFFLQLKAKFDNNYSNSKQTKPSSDVSNLIVVPRMKTEQVQHQWRQFGAKMVPIINKMLDEYYTNRPTLEEIIKAIDQAPHTAPCNVVD